MITADRSGWSTHRTGASRTFGAAVDAAGNLFVAAGNDGLYVRRAGESSFRRHALPQFALSIAAGAAGVAYVGYNGANDCDMAFFTGGTADVYKSGDADRIVLSGEGIDRYHYDISSPAGVSSQYPNGREKLCTVNRVIYDPVSHSVWFGANHGVAWGDPDSTRNIEHTHPAINCYSRDEGGDLTMCSGSYWALAADANGDLWLGGTERSALFPYMTLNKNFDAADRHINAKDASGKAVNKVDWWADLYPTDARPSQRVDDRPMGFAPTKHGVWTGSLVNGVAFRSKEGKIAHFTVPLISKEISAVRLDPKDGSVWFGHTNGGITRLKDNGWVHYKGFVG